MFIATLNVPFAQIPKGFYVFYNVFYIQSFQDWDILPDLGYKHIIPSGFFKMSKSLPF